MYIESFLERPSDIRVFLPVFLCLLFNLSAGKLERCCGRSPPLPTYVVPFSGGVAASVDGFLGVIVVEGRTPNGVAYTPRGTT